MTGSTTFSLHRRVLIGERALLIDVTLDAGCISSGSQTRLLQFESAVRIVAIVAAHRALQDLVMEGHRKLRLHFGVTPGAKLRVIRFKHSSGSKAGLLGIRRRHQRVR